MIKRILSVALIFCFTVLNSNAAFVKKVDGVRISKERVKLESFLNKKYRLYKYTLRNEGDEEFFLELNPFDKELAYKSAQDIYRRDKFPYSYGHLVRATGETVGAGVSAIISLLFFPIALTSESFFDIYAFENIPLGVEIPKTYIINPVKSLLFLPYDKSKNQENILEAKNELKEIESLLERRERHISIKPGEKVEFYELLPIEEGYSEESTR